MLSCTLCSCCTRSPSATPSASPNNDSQFFETINPLNGFDGKESLETYMWGQSLKVEPKDPDKMEFIKPTRPAHVLKSPGIKPPKGISTPSTSGPSNHYSGHRASGRGFSAFNNYSPSVSYQSDISRPNFLSNFEDRNSHLGMVEINPGQQPRYLGDARRGAQSTISSPTEPRAPPIMPRARHRNDKASSTPPSPQSLQNNENSISAAPPPPLYPRKTSPQEQRAPPPLKVLAHTAPTMNGPAPPHSAPFSSAHPELPNLFCFPPHGGNTVCSRIAATSLENAPNVAAQTATTGTNAPTIPPRKKAEQLPSPLSDDAVRIVWNGEARPTTPDVSAVISLPSSSSNSNVNESNTPPKLYPRRTYPADPPPRPPKTFHGQKPQEVVSLMAGIERNGADSPPPPLPPKTYKRRQQPHRPS